MIKSILVFILIGALSACTAEKGKNMEEPIKSESLTKHCVGRNMIDLPSSFAATPMVTGIFRPRESASDDPVFDVVVHGAGFSPTKFALEIAKRRAELKKESSQTINVFKLETKLSEDATLFRVQEIDDAYVSELYLLRGTTMLTIRQESYYGRFLHAEAGLVKFASKIIDDVGGEHSGFCLGSVLVGGEFNVEKGDFLFRDGAGADFQVQIDTYAPDERVPLLQRMSGPDSLLSIFDVRPAVIRAGERSVVGMRAQEWLGWAKLTEEQDVKMLQFNLETMRPSPGKTAPRLAVTFETAQPLEDGTPTKTLISDETATKIWDAAIDSIRSTEG